MSRKVFLILARMKRALSLEGMAQSLGISARQYSNYENGHTKRIPDNFKQKIAELLQIDENLIELEEGHIIISGNTINQGAIMNNTNNYASDILTKELEDERELNKRLREQIDLLKETIATLSDKIAILEK